MLLGLDIGYAFKENRVPSPRPELKLDQAVLGEFPIKFEAYFNDKFGFRRRLTQWLNYTKVVLLGDSPSPKVVLGSKGWLFYGDLDVDLYRRVKPLKLSELENWRHLLESRRDWLAARGIPYLVVIAPSKSSIYPELMPSVYTRVARNQGSINSWPT